jgi:DNA-binding NarL/FixJ family response regulator
MTAVATPASRVRCRVGIVDDHALLAQTVALSLVEKGYEAVTLQPLAPADILTFAEDADLDVVLLDLDLGDAGSSLDAIAGLRALGCKVVVVTGNTSPVALGTCFEAGADEVITKAVSFDDLIDRVGRILDGAKSRAPREDLLATLRHHRDEERRRLEPFTRLTAREAEVLNDLMLGIAADDIATTRYVSVATVRSHIRSILQKLEVNSQLAAVALAVQSEWLFSTER